MITAPYNFVPLNKEVFYPDWDKDVSHDVPFKDGESGVIDITITAESPIFIRNHYVDGDKYYTSKSGEKISKEFCNRRLDDGGRQYYIPASSLKGAVRSTLEILSFAELEFMDDSRLSVRDMTDQKRLVGTAEGFGLLKQRQDDTFYLVDYGKPRTIESKEIKKHFDKYWFREESVLQKYKTIKPYTTIPVEPYMKPLQNRQGRPLGKKKDARYAANGEKGILLMSNYIQRKHHEFVLIESDIIDPEVPLPEKVIEKFKSIYFSQGDSDTHKLGDFWKKQLKTDKGKQYGIPVFYTKNGSQITNIGMTQLFKLAYNKSLKEAAKQKIESERFDLVQTMFGTIKNDIALKGRVFFSHFPSTHVRFESEKSEILGEPNPTYYPNYIMQTNISGNKVVQYKTLMDKDAQIRGRKRYPLHGSVAQTKGGNDNEDVRSRFIPLDKETVFVGKVRFHNLKKAEIGALLSALTLHGRENTHRHNLGMAKSLGYGKVRMELRLDEKLRHTKEAYLQTFESLMQEKIPSWKESEQLRELFAMTDANTRPESMLTYQLLDNPKPRYEIRGRKEKNDFVGAKKSKEYLMPFSGNQDKTTVKQKKASLDDLGEKFGTLVKKEKRSGSITVTPKKKPQPKIIRKGINVVKKAEPASSPQTTPSSASSTNTQENPPKVAEYTMHRIAQEAGVSVEEVLHFAKTSTLPIPKNLDATSILKEAQAKGLINAIKKS